MILVVTKAIMEAARVSETGQCEYDHNYYKLLSGLATKYMQKISRKYPHCGFGCRFYQWVFSDEPEPYNSFGNGATMRVRPVASYFCYFIIG